MESKSTAHNCSTLRWKRSEDGYTETHCGRYEIEPVFMGCTTAQAYHLVRVDEGGARTRLGSYVATQKIAKLCAQRDADKQRGLQRDQSALGDGAERGGMMTRSVEENRTTCERCGEERSSWEHRRVRCSVCGSLCHRCCLTPTAPSGGGASCGTCRWCEIARCGGSWRCQSEEEE